MAPYDLAGRRARRDALTRWVLLGALLAALGLAALRVEFSYDLSLFLPAPETDAEHILMDRLGEAPGSQMLFVALPGATVDEVEAARETLLESGLFMDVLSGAHTPEFEDIPKQLARYRYLFVDVDWSVAGLTRALEDRVAEASLFGGKEWLDLLRADPVHALPLLLNRLAVVSNPASTWRTSDGAAVLVAQGKDDAFDLAAQQALVRAVGRLLPNAQVRGVGAVGVRLKDTIHAEATQRSVIATFALALVLLVAYRRIHVIWIAALPLLLGALSGLAAVALTFDQVHGITLAFGFTLLGVAIDYPLHLLSHCRSQPPQRALRTILPTLRIGLLSTVIAYAALALSGSEGLAQLGLFTAVGLVGAAVGTAVFIPPMGRAMRSPGTPRAPAPPRLHVGWALAGLIVGAIAIALAPQRFDDDLSTLSPVPAQELTRDNLVREAVGSPDARYMVAIQAQTSQEALDGVADIGRWLEVSGLVERSMHPALVVPPVTLQQRRQEQIPAAHVLRERLAAAASLTAFAPTAFEPFVEAAVSSRALDPLTPQALADPGLRSLVDSHLYQARDQWIALISLYGEFDATALARGLEAEKPGALLVDLRSASQSLVVRYRGELSRVLAIALGIIAGLLLVGLAVRRALWALATLLGGLAVTAGALLWGQGPLNLYHLCGLLLVGGLGLDYALFASRDDRDRRALADSRHAVTACAVSTIAVFTVLALSAIPALASLGTAVATGAAVALALARLGIRA